MKLKKIFIFIMAGFMLFAITKPVFALNRVELKVTSEGIKYKATCDKAGSFSIEFDAGTTLTHGDQITIDLPYSGTSGRATLCQDIDIIVGSRDKDLSGSLLPIKLNGSNGGGWDPADYGGFFPATGSPLVAGEGTPSVAPTSTQGSVFFHIRGSAGQGRITVDVLGEDQTTADGNGVSTLKVGSTTGSTITIKFFDEATYPNPVAPGGIFEDSDGDGSYDKKIGSNQNVLCINISQWLGGTVDVSVDSRNDKFTFQDTGVQIAHVISDNVSVYTCSKQSCASIVRSTEQSNCEFDNDTGAGYCDEEKKNRLIIEALGTFDPGIAYQIEAKILVNGQYSDSQGVYFSSAGVITRAYASKTDACNALSTTAMYTFTPANYTATYKTAMGTSVSDPLASNSNCLVSASSRATYLITSSTKIFPDASYRYLYVDLPTFIYDSSLVKDGDKVEVEFTILKSSCGELIKDTFCVGTFGCTSAEATQTSLLYPYFTRMSDDPAVDTYWDGIVVTNMSNSAGTATIIVYEQDGDVGTMNTPTIASHSIYANLLSDLYRNMIKIAGNGILGDSRCYIVVCPNFKAHGFAMMANPMTGESLGYLPAKETGICQ